jgi:hypothetical protein
MSSVGNDILYYTQLFKSALSYIVTAGNSQLVMKFLLVRDNEYPAFLFT